jgi:hypothetical protein
MVNPYEIIYDRAKKGDLLIQVTAKEKREMTTWTGLTVYMASPKHVECNYHTFHRNQPPMGGGGGGCIYLSYMYMVIQ